MEELLAKAPEAHRRFLAGLSSKTAHDSRLLGVAVAGSISTGTADSESDIDLLIVARDSDYPQLSKERQPFIEQFGRLLASFTGEHVGEPRLTICLFEQDLLHVDFKFVTLEAFSDQRVEDPAILWEAGTVLSDAVKANPRSYPEVDVQWIEDRFWVWVHYVATKIKRGETLEALDSLAWLRQLALSPMARAHNGGRNRASRFLERDAPRHSRKLLETTPTGSGTQELKRSLQAAVDIYVEFRRPLLERLTLRTQAENAVRSYVEAL